MGDLKSLRWRDYWWNEGVCVLRGRGGVGVGNSVAIHLVKEEHLRQMK